MQRTEASIERACMNKAVLEGFLLLKLHHGIVGMPDRLLVCPGGLVVFIEFKRGTAEPDAIQRYWLDILREMGHRVEVIRSVAAFRLLLTTATEGGKMLATPMVGAGENE